MTGDGGLAHPQTPEPAAPVICARCRVGEVTYGTGICPLCGYSPATGQVVEDPLPAALDEGVRRELGGEFRIERLLGRGGMPLVYLARELELNRLVAVKVLPIQLSMGHDAVERFKREAKIGASLDHPHIVPVHRIGTTPTFLVVHHEVGQRRLAARPARLGRAHEPPGLPQAAGAGCGGPALRAPAGNHSPRHQAGQYPH